jgi:hypothetical protein
MTAVPAAPSLQSRDRCETTYNSGVCGPAPDRLEPKAAYGTWRRSSMILALGNGRNRTLGGRLLLAVAALSAVGGCPRPEDRFEPNNTALTATPLVLGLAVEGRVSQGNPDVFIINADARGTLRLVMNSIGQEEEDCAAFRLEDQGGTVLYDDQALSCSRGLDEPVRAAGVTLGHVDGAGYELAAPVEDGGVYLLTLRELGYADNVFTYSWHYRVTAMVE